MSLWSRFFGKKPKDLFLQFLPHESDWRIVNWNFDLNIPHERKWSIEINGEKNHLVQWQKSKHEEVKFFDGESLLCKGRVHDQELKLLMNLAIHSTLKYSLESNHEFMVTPVAGATTLDMQNEFRSLQWLQGTLGTLLRALDKLETDQSLILTAAFFSGMEPVTGERIMRLIAFNLDIFFYMKPDQSLLIVIFDDKGMGHGTSKTPTFQQIIKVTKPQFYDEIVKLVHRLAIVGEIR